MREEVSQQTIDRALAQATDTRHVVLGTGAVDGVADTFAASFGDRAAVVVADDTTYEVAGASVDRLLRATRRVVRQPVIFPTSPRLHADFEVAVWLGERLAEHDAIPVAVGSGTLNDITKLGSHRAGRAYMVVATAASMDGYAAFGAAMTRDGFKQTIACPAPRAVVTDPAILAAAPAELTAFGFGDLIGKITAGADWILADRLGVESIDASVWSMVQPGVRQVIGEPERLRAQDPQAVGTLFLCLIMSGLAMQAARSSRPASGSEHQFSHLWEMSGLSHQGRDISHGFKVGIGTLAIAAVYERLLERDLAELDVEELCRRIPTAADVQAEVQQAHSDPTVRAQALVEMQAKRPTADGLRARLARVGEAWPVLREALRAQLLAADEVRRLLVAAGCPAEPEDIGVTPQRLRATYVEARHIRRRYTVLDLAAEAGLLGSLVDELFEPGGYWARTRNAASGSADALDGPRLARLA
jgi:glycerol-1-phosphate dehydrogenase [NAD(P)+]